MERNEWILTHEGRCKTNMEALLPKWMELVVFGGTAAVGVFVLQIVDRFQNPKK